MSWLPPVTLALVAAVVGCGSPAAPARSVPATSNHANGDDAEPGRLNSPTATQLIRDLDTWEASVEIAQRKDPSVGLGDSVVRVEGEPVWPPAGETCLGLVQCCEQLAGKDRIFGLLCQLAIARDGNCDKGLQKVSTIVVEAEMKLPDACVRAVGR